MLFIKLKIIFSFVVKIKEIFMVKVNELYKCNVCGNIVEIVNAGFGELVCCSVPMSKLEVQTHEEEYGEKHIPVIIKEENGEHVVKVGSVEHPMSEEHHIMFIEAISPDKQYITRKYLQPGEKPELKLECKCSHLIARALCNIHGLWESLLHKEK